jgi:hypothetical protein
MLEQPSTRPLRDFCAQAEIGERVLGRPAPLDAKTDPPALNFEREGVA